MITISVITPTFCREDLLQRCVESVLAQEVEAQIEHFVVNDAGFPLQPAAWMDDSRVTVLNTYRTERSVARNTGAALSRGDWLYFLDDDDYAKPGAFAAMAAVAKETEAVHLYGDYETLSMTTHQTHLVQPRLPERPLPIFLAGEVLAPQTSWIRRSTFFATGGFDPLMVPAEDADLFRRVNMLGTAVGVPVTMAVARIEHPATTTTNPHKNTDKFHQGQEKCLNMPETFALVSRDTLTAPYWRGRCAREYAASAWRNLRAGRRLLVLSRLAGFIHLSRGFGKNTEFRQGLRRQPGPAAVLA